MNPSHSNTNHRSDPDSGNDLPDRFAKLLAGGIDEPFLTDDTDPLEEKPYHTATDEEEKQEDEELQKGMDLLGQLTNSLLQKLIENRRMRAQLQEQMGDLEIHQQLLEAKRQRLLVRRRFLERLIERQRLLDENAPEEVWAVEKLAEKAAKLSKGQ